MTKRSIDEQDYRDEQLKELLIEVHYHLAGQVATSDGEHAAYSVAGGLSYEDKGVGREAG